MKMSALVLQPNTALNCKCIISARVRAALWLSVCLSVAHTPGSGKEKQIKSQKISKRFSLKIRCLL